MRSGWDPVLGLHPTGDVVLHKVDWQDCVDEFKDVRLGNCKRVLSDLWLELRGVLRRHRPDTQRYEATLTEANLSLMSGGNVYLGALPRSVG